MPDIIVVDDDDAAVVFAATLAIAFVHSLLEEEFELLQNTFQKKTIF